MAEKIIVQGRWLDAEEIAGIGELIAAHPQWSRRRLSEALARQWDWRNGAGRLKDMAARALLVKLHQRKLIELPPRRSQPANRMRRCLSVPLEWDQQPIEMSLGELGALRVEEISGDRTARDQMAAALKRWHYLGYGGSVGENLQYAILDSDERPLAYAVFGAAAWKCHDRDRFIGWPPPVRARNLGFIANNCRFLILPWVKVPQLASWILGQLSRRVSADWQAKYGHRVVLLESFVQADRFRGSAYAAANWIEVGASCGRSRQDRQRQIQAPLKMIYLRPLRPDFREVLCA